MTVPEVIAQLDALERELERFTMQLRTLRNDLYEALDSDSNELVD